MGLMSLCCLFMSIVKINCHNLCRALKRMWGIETVSRGFPRKTGGGLDGKESACNAGDLGSIPGSRRSLGEGNGLPSAVFLPGEFRGQRVRHNWATFRHTYSHETFQSWNGIKWRAHLLMHKSWAHALSLIKILSSGKDAHRHSWKLWRLDAEMLRVALGKELGWASLPFLGAHCLYHSSLQNRCRKVF